MQREEVFVVKNSNSLKGKVEISGSKNAILPILCSTILVDEKCVISNVAPYSDVMVLIEILKELGKVVEYDIDSQTVNIFGKVKTDYELDENLMNKIRASFLVCGALIGKNKEARVPERERLEMMEVSVSEMGWDVSEVVERTEREWMVLLLGLSEEATERMVEAVKRFLERVWCVRCRE